MFLEIFVVELASLNLWAERETCCLPLPNVWREVPMRKVAGLLDGKVMHGVLTEADTARCTVLQYSIIQYVRSFEGLC